jgi:hypothetical protein
MTGDTAKVPFSRIEPSRVPAGRALFDSSRCGNYVRWRTVRICTVESNYLSNMDVGIEHDSSYLLTSWDKTK